MDFIKEMGLIMLACSAVICLPFILLFFLANTLSSISCETTWINSGYEARYSAMSGCLVSKDGKTWFPENTIRIVE